MDIREILELSRGLGSKVVLRGWVKSHRSQKNISFIELNDGSTSQNLQVIHRSHLEDIPIGSSIEVEGTILESPAEGQKYELGAERVEVLSPAVDYPIQKKEHTIEWLREVTHLRHRTGTFTSVNLIKSKLYHLVNKFFEQENFR